MAEAWARRLFPSDWEAHSAGLLIYRITERTRAAMREVGIEMAGQKPKTIDTFDLDSFDRVVTLSEEAGRYLPRLAHPERRLDRPVDDPMAAEGSPAEVAAAFREGREKIRAIVASLIAGDFSRKDA
jgi:arsenate reductase